MRKLTSWSLRDIVVFLMIWVYFTLNAQYLNFSGSHILRWVFPGVLILWALLNHNGKIVRSPEIFVWLSVAILPSIFFSDYKGESFIKYLSLVVILYGSYIFFSALRDRHLLIRCLDILMIVLFIYQILDFAFVIAGINSDNGRAQGITTNPNTLGIYANLAYWAIVYAMAKTKKFGLKIIYSAVLVTSVLTSIASGSRTAFVILIINILLTGILTFRHSPLILIFIGGSALVAYMFWTGKMSSLNIVALNRLLEEGGTSRTELWEAAMTIWRDYRFFGVGYTVSNLFNPIEPGMAFHNSYISYLVETGVWGAAILSLGFARMIIRIGHSLWAYRDKFNAEINELSIACIMAILLLIAAWSESFLFAVGSTEGFTFWFLIAWILAYINQLHYEGNVS